MKRALWAAIAFGIIAAASAKAQETQAPCQPDFAAEAQRIALSGQNVGGGYAMRSLVEVLNDPRVQDLYRDYCRASGRLTPSQFAFAFAATHEFARGRLAPEQAFRDATRPAGLPAEQPGWDWRQMQDVARDLPARAATVSIYRLTNGEQLILPPLEEGRIYRSRTTGDYFSLARGVTYIFGGRGWTPLRRIAENVPSVFPYNREPS